MLVTTTDTLQDQQIETYLEIVTAEVVYGTNVLRDFSQELEILSVDVREAMKESSKKGNKKLLKNCNREPKSLMLML